MTSETATITVNAQQKPEEILYGDADRNGTVNSKDLTALRRHLAEWSGYSADAIDFSASDVNLDREVNSKDATVLARYLAQWTDVSIGR